MLRVVVIGCVTQVDISNRLLTHMKYGLLLRAFIVLIVLIFIVLFLCSHRLLFDFFILFSLSAFQHSFNSYFHSLTLHPFILLQSLFFWFANHSINSFISPNLCRVLSPLYPNPDITSISLISTTVNSKTLSSQHKTSHREHVYIMWPSRAPQRVVHHALHTCPSPFPCNSCLHFIPFELLNYLVHCKPEDPTSTSR